MSTPPPLRVLFISGQDGGTRRYRCFQPQEQLEGQGITTGFREADEIGLLADVLDYDIFILHRVPYSDLVGRLLKLIHQRAKIAIFETDDLVFEPDLVQYDGLYRGLSPVEARQYMRKVRDHLKALKACDYALTTTEYLADALRHRGIKTFINRNALSAEFVRLAQAVGRPTPKGPDEPVLLGYVSGSASHDRDFEVLSEALLHVMDRHPQVRLRVIGHLNLDRRLAPLRQRIQVIPFMPWRDVPAASGDIDVNLAPLEIDNPFCQSKSELKYFEGGILGIPTVASRTRPFAFAIRHGENGFLAGDTQEWINSLELLITDPDRRRAVGEVAYRDVLERYTPQARGPQFAELLRELVTQHRPDPDLILEPEQLERRVIAHLADLLDERIAPFDTTRPPRLEDDAQWRRLNLTARLEEALAVVRRERRRPLARWVAGAKSAVKKVTGRVQRLELEGETYRLIGELTDGQHYGQSFRATAPNLYRIDLLFATYARVNTPDLIFRLKTSPTDEIDLFTRTVSASLLYDNRFYPFVFDPLPDAAGQRYYFSVESPGAVRGDALGLWAYLNPIAAEGRMYKNGQPVAGQLAYKAYYKELDER